jgi:hypothetical protein
MLKPNAARSSNSNRRSISIDEERFGEGMRDVDLSEVWKPRMIGNPFVRYLSSTNEFRSGVKLF